MATVAVRLEKINMNIGIAGTGKMGSAIAKRLLGLGHRVTVWNRTPAGAHAAVEAGATLAHSIKDLAKSVEAVITILTDAAAIEAVYGGANGLLAADVRGKLIVEMSTVRPHTQRELGLRVAAVGATHVECPVGGTVGPALEGKLFGFAGGADVDVARARPLLEGLCRRIEHVGPLGAGATMKLAINLPLMIYWQALSEAISLAQPLGLEPQRLLDILADTSGAATMLKARGPRIAQALAGAPSGPATVDVATMCKDLRSMLDEGAAQGRDLPAAASALAVFERASASGLGSADGVQLPLWWVREGGRRSG